MPDMQAIRKQVLAKLVPLEKENKAVGEFVSKLLHHAERLGFEAIVCGSIGKNTWLAGDHDIDLFLFFPASTSREELEKRGLAAGKNIATNMGGKWHVKYAEHPYVHAIIKGFDIDIVPCYKISKGEHIKSAVDRSPLHLAYVNEHLKPEQRGDVRLLKQFCKGADVYGADTKTQGISGYICELLVMHHGTFETVLNVATTWRAPQMIGEADARKFDSPFIVIDPTDINRNAAAAISAENFARFVFAAQEFLKRPSADRFFPDFKKLSTADISKLKQRGTHWHAITAPRPNVIDDVLWPQMRRARHRLVKELEHNEFKVIRSFEWADDDETTNARMAIVFEFEVHELPNVQRMHGPLLTAHEHSARFLEKYGRPLFGPFVDGQGSWFIEKTRPFKTADALLGAFLKRSTKELEEAGIPNNIANVMKKQKTLDGDDFWKFAQCKGVSEFMWKKYMKKLR